MKKKIISMLLTGILTFTGMPMYIQAAEFDESAASFEDFDDGSGAEESTVVSEDTVDEEETAAEAETLEEVEDEASADIYVNQDEQEEILLQEDTAGDTEQESTEENLELFSEAADTDVKSESEESGGTLTTGVSWKLSADGNLQISGSGAV